MVAVFIVFVVSLIDPIHWIIILVAGFGLRYWPWAACAAGVGGVISVLAFTDGHSSMATATLIGRPLALATAAGLISWGNARRRAARATIEPKAGIDILAALRKPDSEPPL